MKKKEKENERENLQQPIKFNFIETIYSQTFILLRCLILFSSVSNYPYNFIVEIHSNAVNSRFSSELGDEIATDKRNPRTIIEMEISFYFFFFFFNVVASNRSRFNSFTKHGLRLFSKICILRFFFFKNFHICLFPFIKDTHFEVLQF